MTTPEQRAREVIDAKLVESGWAVQDSEDKNLFTAGPGVAVREFILEGDHGHADYLLFVDGKAVGALEAKPEGYPLTSVEPQGAGVRSSFFTSSSGQRISPEAQDPLLQRECRLPHRDMRASGADLQVAPGRQCGGCEE